MQLLIALSDDETTPQWLRQIPVVEILRQTWIHQYYVETHAHLSDVDQTEPIHETLASKELLPSEHVVDAGYVDGDLLISSKVEHEVDVVGPVRPNTSWQAKIPGGYDNS